MSYTFGTKSETLAQLEGHLKHVKVLPQIRFTIAEWKEEKSKVIKQIFTRSWGKSLLIVRSSGIAEDTLKESLAGHFSTVLNVIGKLQLEEAVEAVIKSIEAYSRDDQIFVQPMLQEVQVSGVAFTRDPNTGGYYDVINYDDQSGKTDTVTSGTSNVLKTFYNDKTSTQENANNKFSTLFSLLRELEELFSNDSLDVEFAIKDGELYLLQVRPLILSMNCRLSMKQHAEVLSQISRKVRCLNRPHPYLHGSKTVFGIMPDWNPAEIIGIRPRPFALSLYKDLVTDNIWAYQRNNYGYRNLRSFPLLISFAGLPYIDVRVSFNSFIPADIDDDLAERLVNYYIERLIESPSKHDKVEFEIIYSCYTLDLRERLALLLDHGFNVSDCEILSESLRHLTNNIIHKEAGLWKQDIEKISKLADRQKLIKNSDLDPIGKIYWLIEDCKRYGTLPFAGLARAGFMAVQLLRSLVNVGIMDENDYQGYLQSLNTVSSQMSADFANLSKKSFLEKYGHLRPGTYDILSARYDETPDCYFDWVSQTTTDSNRNQTTNFSVSLEQLTRLESCLKEHKIEHDVLSIFRFIKGAIEGREFAKFVFTKSLSDVMLILTEFAELNGLSREDISYADINIVRHLYASSDDSFSILKQSIDEGRRKYDTTLHITLPPLITSHEDIFCFEFPKNKPNFITLKSIKGDVVSETDDRRKMGGNILMIPNADPGYDWIFSHGLGGFITMYGGTNSHMAIRASELGIPAVIGSGETLYNQWTAAKTLELDCAKQQVRVLR
jgi:phosphohistidine swiveling domain-containing protein